MELGELSEPQSRGATEKQARAVAYILTRNASIQQLSVDSSSFGPKFKKLDKPNKAVSTRKCILENWLSLRSDSGETEVATAAKRCVEIVTVAKFEQ